jgi:hypothetical protein
MDGGEKLKKNTAPSIDFRGPVMIYAWNKNTHFLD